MDEERTAEDGFPAWYRCCGNGVNIRTAPDAGATSVGQLQYDGRPGHGPPCQRRLRRPLRQPPQRPVVPGRPRGQTIRHHDLPGTGLNEFPQPPGEAGSAGRVPRRQPVLLPCGRRSGASFSSRLLVDNGVAPRSHGHENGSHDQQAWSKPGDGCSPSRTRYDEARSPERDVRPAPEGHRAVRNRRGRHRRSEPRPTTAWSWPCAAAGTAFPGSAPPRAVWSPTCRR